MAYYSNAALSDEFVRLKLRLDKQSERMAMMQGSLNEAIQLLNVIAKFLDGQSTTRKDPDNPLRNMRLTFVGKRLEYLELTGPELAEGK